MSDSSLGCWPFLLGFAALAFYAHQEAQSPFLTVYKGICSKPAGTNEVVTWASCRSVSGARKSAYSMTYRVDYDRQRVVSMGFLLTRYDNCEVADKYNWTCKFADGSGNISAVDGRQYEADPASHPLGYVEYLLIQWGILR